MKVEFGDNKAIEQSMRSGLSSQVNPRFMAGKGTQKQQQSDMKSQGGYSQQAANKRSPLRDDQKRGDQSKSQRSRKTAAMMNRKETVVDEVDNEGSYYDDQQEEYESEYDEEGTGHGNPFQDNMAATKSKHQQLSLYEMRQIRADTRKQARPQTCRKKGG